jgi:hypothetical protein
MPPAEADGALMANAPRPAAAAIVMVVNFLNMADLRDPCLVEPVALAREWLCREWARAGVLRSTSAT